MYREQYFQCISVKESLVLNVRTVDDFFRNDTLGCELSIINVMGGFANVR